MVKLVYQLFLRISFFKQNFFFFKSLPDDLFYWLLMIFFAKQDEVIDAAAAEKTEDATDGKAAEAEAKEEAVEEKKEGMQPKIVAKISQYIYLLCNNQFSVHVLKRSFFKIIRNNL